MAPEPGVGAIRSGRFGESAYSYSSNVGILDCSSSGISRDYLDGSIRLFLLKIAESVSSGGIPLNRR